DKRLEGVLEYGWFAPLSKLLLVILNFFYGIFKSYGFAIILITILTRVLLLPFTLRGDMNRRKSLDAQKKLAYIEQKYKHDPEMLARERAEYTRKHVLPGLLGMVPYLFQIPLFIALQRVLSHAIELYKAPFLWIPDLSSADPYYILPALISLGMVFQFSGVGDPRKQVTNILIALIIGAFTAQFSAGLALFIGVSTLLGIAQMALQKEFNL
nr:membrane protein insertase YidC [Candidatus Dependentiae bacterium]